MQKLPKVSIGLPAFKARYLHEAVESVLNQTYKDFELIIVNDDSPENVEEIVFKFDDERIKYYKNDENLGKYSVVKSWNRCLDYANGEYFVLFSDDDVYHPDFLLEMIKLAEKYSELDVFHCRVKIIDKDGGTVSYAPTCPEYEDLVNFMWHRVSGYRVQYVTDFLCRTKALVAIGGFYDLPLAWGSDDVTWYQLAKEKGIAYSSKILCYWRWSGANISSIGDVNQRIMASNLRSEFIESFINTIDNSKHDEHILNDLQKILPIKKAKNVESLVLSNSSNASIMELLKLKFNKQIDTYSLIKFLIRKIDKK
jgi:glycosyltransferase involved in cell wall biosynthesis